MKNLFRFRANRFYVYVLRDPRDKKVFYVGCTQRPEIRGLNVSSYSEATSSRMREIRDAGSRHIREIAGIFDSRSAASDREEALVKELRVAGVQLTNSPNRMPYPHRVIQWEAPTTPQTETSQTRIAKRKRQSEDIDTYYRVELEELSAKRRRMEIAQRAVDEYWENLRTQQKRKRAGLKPLPRFSNRKDPS